MTGTRVNRSAINSVVPARDQEASGALIFLAFRGFSAILCDQEISRGNTNLFPRCFPNQPERLNMKLTTANIRLPEGKSDHIVFDNALTGFGLRVRRLSGGNI